MQANGGHLEHFGEGFFSAEFLPRIIAVVANHIHADCVHADQPQQPFLMLRQASPAARYVDPALVTQAPVLDIEAFSTFGFIEDG
ncbi:hypothetical protein D3C75_1289320 [compost metagenome]